MPHHDATRESSEMYWSVLSQIPLALQHLFLFDDMYEDLAASGLRFDYRTKTKRWVSTLGICVSWVHSDELH